MHTSYMIVFEVSTWKWILNFNVECYLCVDGGYTREGNRELCSIPIPTLLSASMVKSHGGLNVMEARGHEFV